MSKSLPTWSLLVFLGLTTSTTSCAQKRTQQKQTTTVQKQRTESPEAMLKRFYTEYIRSFDRMYEPAQMDSLILANATPEAKAKLERVRALTDSDPFIRAQDLASGSEGSLQVRALGQDWYQVSFGSGDGYRAIPLHLLKSGDKYLIDFITPEWHHTEYGDKLRSNPFASTKSVDMTSPINFIRSFYECYISHYLAMKPELEAELKALRDRYCTKATIQQYYEGLASVGEVESGFFDTLIDNVDFDPSWCSSLSVRPSSASGVFEVSYSDGEGERHKWLVCAVSQADGSYRLDRQP